MYIRRQLRGIIATIMVIMLLPGWLAAVEQLGELAPTGDQHYAHAEHALAKQLVVQGGVSELGCTSLDHHCSCHRSVPAVLMQLPTIRPVPVSFHASSGFCSILAPATRATSPPVPPPIA